MWASGCSFTVILIVVIGSEGSINKNLAISAPMVTLTPEKPFLLQINTAVVLCNIDTTHYFETLLSLAHVHRNLSDKVGLLEVDNKTWPQISSLAMS